MAIQNDLSAVLERVRHQEATQQSQRIDQTSKMVDDLVRKGIVEGPTYRLAPTTAVPHRISGMAKFRL